MLPSALITKLQATTVRHAELQEKLNDPAVLSDSKQLIAISKESGRLTPVVEMFADYQKTKLDIEGLEEMAQDKEMAELAAEELPIARKKLTTLEQKLLDRFLAAEDSGVDKFFVELRAGTGGDEAALFVRDLLHMYQVYCETNGWAFSVDDFSETEHGGFKEAIISVRGDEAYRHLKFEAGGHRVQRVPETETQGRIHTSAATVAVLPELDDIEIHIDMKDIEEGGCKGGGPGGQNVNKVETGWRISHKPSGLHFKITEQKSQGQNKERAWALLRSTLYEMEHAKQHAEQTANRKSMMGSGDRSQRIRTYNFPQNRCTDHRLGGEDSEVKNFNLDKIIAGEMDPLIKALMDLDKQERLAAL